MSIVNFRCSLCVVCLVALSFLNVTHAEEVLTAVQRSELLSSVTRIRYERQEGNALIVGHGTAFGIDLGPFGQQGQRYLLSAAHNVLDKAGKPYPTLKIEIPIQDGHMVASHCRVICTDSDLDLCLFECDRDLPGLVVLAAVDEPAKAPVILAGSPRGIPVRLFDGTLVRRFHEGSVRSLAELEFDHGCSGGPLFSARTGKVIGVAVAGIPKGDDLDHSKGLFVPASAIESFISPLSKTSSVLRTPQPFIPASSVSSVKVNATAPVQVEHALIPTPTRTRRAGPANNYGTFQSPYGNGKEATADGRYVIRAGDTLAAIALDFHVSARMLMILNDFYGDEMLEVGSVIRVR
jgi:LysM repeat protein